MGMTDARKALIAALRAGNFEHEIRDVQAEKNLLAIGEVDEEFVITLLHRTKGDQFTEAPHHWDGATTVYTFRPWHDGRYWYVKAYFVDDQDSRAVFISVH